MQCLICNPAFSSPFIGDVIGHCTSHAPEAVLRQRRRSGCMNRNLTVACKYLKSFTAKEGAMETFYF
ncbi:hypothetical protein PR048_005857 [Dryococelus australis]|uniref:Uncharacterized protein n=1 Tax=Dryococelus australis TaxID=614101 RepID=A0ABQ9I9F9_9NEOP|nr:hypothetical protein PR048_005857 [Dryococelus australis]